MMLSRTTKNMSPAKHQKAPQFDEVTLIQLTSAFKIFDNQNSGVINDYQLKTLMRSFRISTNSEAAKEIFSNLNLKPGQQNIKFDTYLRVMEHLLGPRNSRDEIQKVFKIFMGKKFVQTNDDEDDEKGSKDGLNLDTLRRLVDLVGEQISQEELKAMFDEVDIDGDGALDSQQFYRIMRHRLPSEEVDSDND